jgi:hypothetical protein
MPIFAENSAPVTEAATQTITTAFAAQVVFADTKRSYLLVQNISDTDMWMEFNSPGAVGRGIRLLANGGGYVAESGFIPSGTVRIICSAAGKAFYAIQG